MQSGTSTHIESHTNTKLGTNIYAESFKMGQKQPSNSAIGFCVGHLLLGMEPALKSGLFAQWDSIGENYFFLWSGYQLETASVLEMGACVHLAFHHWTDAVWFRPMQALCMLPQSLVYVCVSPAVFRRP